MADDKRHVHEATATADAQGVRSGDDVVAVSLALAGDADASPDTTTPEHLMAAALAGCLQQALTVAASTQNSDFAPTVTSTVTLTTGEGGGYTALFDLVVSGTEGAQGDQLLEQAKVLCPFTKALDSERLTVRLA